MSPDDDDIDWDDDVGPPHVDYTDLVYRVLSDYGHDNLPGYVYRFIGTTLRDMGRFMDPAAAAKRERELRQKFSSLRDKTEVLQRDIEELDVLDRRDIDACIAGLYSVIGEDHSAPEHTDAIIADLAKLRDALHELALGPQENPPKPGRPPTQRGLAAQRMYDLLHRAGVTDVWKCSQIIVDILDGNVADKNKRVQAMYDRLSRRSDK